MSRLSRRAAQGYKALRKQFTPAALILSIAALVLALAGGAYAASSGGKLFGKQKKEVEKIAKKYAGKPGATGPAGPAGAAGKEGPEGPQGKPGKEGKEGKEGSPWTAGGTLPSKSTETGVFALAETAQEIPFGNIRIPISFTIPLSAPLQNAEECGEAGKPACVVHVFEGETIPTGCTGSVVEGGVAKLGAEPGNLCIYLRNGRDITAAELFPLNEEGGFAFGAGRDGTILITGTQPEGVAASGTWAVTAP